MSYKNSTVIEYSLYNIASQKYSLFTNKPAIEQHRSGYPTIIEVIKSYPTIVLPTLTVLPGVTLVLVDGPILTPSSNPALRGVNLEVVGGTTQENEAVSTFISTLALSIHPNLCTLSCSSVDITRAYKGHHLGIPTSLTIPSEQTILNLEKRAYKMTQQRVS